MNLLNRESLASTLDALSESLFFGYEISTAQRTACAKWISSRQGLPGAYSGMFAPTEQDRQGIRLFTGEAVRSRAGISHQLGEEGCRVLATLKIRIPKVEAALERAIEGMSARLEASEKQGGSPGLYCCGTCTAGYWRNLALGLFPRSEERLSRGLAHLGQNRSEDGGWHRFPFFYTSVALTEIGPDLAGHEMRYAALRWHDILPKLSRAKTSLAQRRATVGRRLLELCET